MKSLRSWYIYLASAVSLLVFAFQAIGLLRALLIPTNRPPIAEIALQVAAIVVALPFYLVHWSWAQRLAQNETQEIGSVPRRLYLYVILAVFAGVVIDQSILLIHSLLDLALGVRRSFYEIPVAANELVLYTVSAILVASLLWTYHWFVLRSDQQHSQETTILVIIRQLYLYGFCAAGLLVASAGASDMLRLLLGNVLPGDHILEADIQRRILSVAIAQLLTGLIIWLLYWRHVQQLFSIPEGPDRQSIIRKIYLYLVVFVAIITFVSNAALLLSALIGRWIGAPDLGTGGELKSSLAILTISGLVWWYHANILGRDAQLIPERGHQALVRRIYRYLTAGVGLAAFLVGLGGLISVLVRGLASGMWQPDLRQQFSWFTATLIAGLPIWLVHWNRVQAGISQRDEPGLEERRSYVRSFYLYFFLLAATISVLASLVYIVSQLVELALGERTTIGLVIDLGQAIAFAIIGVGVWLYHGIVLRQDRQVFQAALPEISLCVWIEDFDPLWRSELVAVLEEKFPGVQVNNLGMNTPLPSREKDSQELNSTTIDAEDEPDKSRGSLAKRKTSKQANFIIATWRTLAQERLADKTIPNDFATPAGNAGLEETFYTDQQDIHRILLALPEEGWKWVGVPSGDVQDLIRAVVDTIRRMIDLR
jgi:hypothetical protein